MLKTDQVFLHIGYHKTGTTLLQSKVIPALETELDRVITPDCSYIAESTSYDPDVFIDQLESARRGPGNDKVLVSAETLSGRGDGNPIWDELRIAERLHRTFGSRARVIVVVRNPYDYIVSLYTFRVVTRGLERREFDRYLEDKFDSWLKRKTDYHRLISRYIELFGRDEILILAYEELLTDYSGFLSRLCSFLGASVPDVPPSRVNPGYRNQRLVTLHRRINAPVSVVLNALRGKSLLTQVGYVRAATIWFGLKRRIVQPVLTTMMSEGPDICIPPRWETHMNTIFREGSRRLQPLMDQDLATLGWPH